MEILFNFGFEPILFIAQIVNFLIIFWLLKKFLYKPVLHLLDERKKKITEGLKQAEESARLMEETLVKEEKILRKAREEAQKLIEEVKVQQQEMMLQTEKETQAKVEKMLREAREQIAYDTMQTEKRLVAHVSKLAIQFIQQSAGTLFGQNEQELVLKHAINKLKKKAD